MPPNSPDPVPLATAPASRPDAASHPAGTLHQYSLITALVRGVYTGEMTFGELRRHGDFGLGTFNDLDGELVAFDGQFYHVRSDGSAGPASADDRTPFAEITFFRPESSHRIIELADKSRLQSLLTQWTEANQFSAIRIDGRFRRVTTRTIGKQTRPYRPLRVVTESQAITNFADVSGTLVGFRSPAFMQGIAVAGVHLHFLSEDRQSGGHALDYELAEGSVQIASLPRLNLELPTNEAFAHADMSLNAEEIENAEG